ncbi:NrfD/PsrC family molybdoenzyme membrane anchor subunit [Raoultibacter phocaeensis]|uniref:NrfD/PsrC family molybdoenzyme membrane anchor subunit n=1 Tax=Raoultibacter phocaeensis TaxID=2479841 RepID=UPI0015D5ACA8|nr:NrfD/PsrC family molybdoenzyme membrane anchor subunit [Raoultibacter phocaeensis]
MRMLAADAWEPLIFSVYIVWYLFLAGVASGAFVVASLCSAYDALKRTNASEALAVRAQGGFIVAPVVMMLAALVLFIDLGSPEKAWQVVLTPFESVVSVGAWLVVLFLVLSAIVALCGLVARTVPSWFLWFSWIAGSALGLGVMTYTGLLLSDLVAIDVWHTWLLPLLFIVSSLATGLACVLAIGALLGNRLTDPTERLWFSSGILGLLEAAVLVAYLVDRVVFSETASASVEALLTGDLAGFFWLGIVVCGIVAPFFIHVLYKKMRGEALLLFGCAGVLVGGFFVRYCIVGAALYTPLAVGGFS